MMLSAAHAHNLTWRSQTAFDTPLFVPGKTKECCAIGALAIALDPTEATKTLDHYKICDDFLETFGLETSDVYDGNDIMDLSYIFPSSNNYEKYAIGSAFREAMKGSK